MVYFCIDIVELKSLPGGPQIGVGDWYLFKLPQALTQLLPLALVLGVELENASKRKFGEWEALLTAGIQPIRIMFMFLITPLVASLFVVVLSFHFAPQALAVWQRRLEQTNMPRLAERQSATWYKLDRELVLSDGSDIPKLVIHFDGDGQVNRWHAAKEPYTDKNGVRLWERGTGWKTGELEPPSESGDLTGIVETKPASSAILPGATLTFRQIEDAISRLERLGHSTAPFAAERALRISMTLACVVLPFTMLGFSFWFGTSSPVRLVAHGIVASVLYWLITAFCWNLVSRNVVSSYWLSYLPPVLFLCCGIFFTITLADTRCRG